MTADDAARAATDEAIERVERHANENWTAAAFGVVVWVAERRPEFTTDPVWAVLERRYPDVQTHEPRALGAVIKKAVREGVIEATDRTHKSVRPECHRNPKAIWRSLIYDDVGRDGR